MKLLALIKVAGNPKVKAYWQMLKRLYGGTDDAVNELKKSRDFGIYHATNKDNIEKILKDKMKPNGFNKGNYFGDRNAAEYFKNRRNNGKIIQFKFPNELTKKQNYPNASSFSKFNDKDLINDIKFHRKHPFNKTMARIPLPIENMKNYRKAKYFGKLKKLNGNLMNEKFNPLENKQTFSNKEISGNLLKKVAGNPKVKVYWQMLKRLYGGTDSTVNKLKKSRDFGIYHGTSDMAKKNILIEGLKSNKATERGTGVFFGSKETANEYGREKIFDTSYANLTKKPGVEVHILDDDISKVLKNHNNYKKDKGAILRLKYPNELKKKENYPNINKTMNFDAKNYDEVGKTVQGGKYYLAHKLTNGFEENRKINRSFTPEKIEHIRKKFNRPSWGAENLYLKGDALEFTRNRLAEKFLKKQNFNKLKYHGTILRNKKNIKLDHFINSDKRNEFLIKDNITPNLIKEVTKK